MSTELRNVPDCVAQNELHQTRFWGGKDRMQCIQITQRKPKGEEEPASKFFNHISITKHQARMLAVELMLFAEGREVEESESHTVDEEALEVEESSEFINAFLERLVKGGSE